MPTFNQLVRNERKTKVYKSKTPVLQHGYNTLTKRPTDQSSPQKEAYAQRLPQRPRRNRTQPCAKSPESA